MKDFFWSSLWKQSKRQQILKSRKMSVTHIGEFIAQYLEFLQNNKGVNGTTK